ncbi:MAG: hypothetical protein HUU25_00935 [Candidatus Sumerlaeia bacterium]|nr:hypothetical protein [Candidatus Sumerlaeia bacterium]
MSSDTPSRGGRNGIWILPLLGVLFVIACAVFTRFMIGPTSEQRPDLWTTPFVPAESPYAVGPDAR